MQPGGISVVPLDGDPTAAEESAGQPLENRAVEELREGGEQEFHQEGKPDDSKVQLMDGGEGGALLATVDPDERETRMQMQDGREEVSGEFLGKAIDNDHDGSLEAANPLLNAASSSFPSNALALPPGLL